MYTFFTTDGFKTINLTKKGFENKFRAPKFIRSPTTCK